MICHISTQHLSLVGAVHLHIETASIVRAGEMSIILTDLQHTPAAMFPVGTVHLQVFHFTALLRHQHVREDFTVAVRTDLAAFQTLVKTAFTELLLTTVDQMGLTQDFHADGADQILWNFLKKLFGIHIAKVFSTCHLSRFPLTAVCGRSVLNSYFSGILPLHYPYMAIHTWYSV